jgi:hypothetical protein
VYKTRCGEKDNPLSDGTYNILSVYLSVVQNKLIHEHSRDDSEDAPIYQVNLPLVIPLWGRYLTPISIEA